MVSAQSLRGRLPGQVAESVKPAALLAANRAGDVFSRRSDAIRGHVSGYIDYIVARRRDAPERHADGQIQGKGCW